MKNRNDLKIVSIDLSHKKKNNGQSYSNQEVETQINMLEQLLLCNFKDYSVQVTQDSYLQATNITIKFKTIEDATFFKLQRPI